MKRSIVAVLTFLAMCVATGASADGNVNFILGTRSLDDTDAWQGVDEQDSFGVVGDFGGSDWPVHLAFGMNVSTESMGLFDSAVAELSAGVSHVFLRETRFRPYVGAGVSSVGVAVDTGFDDDVDQSFGYYGNVGFYGRLGGRLNIGVDYRVLRGTDLSLSIFSFPFTPEFDADGDEVSFLIGFGWPSFGN